MNFRDVFVVVFHVKCRLKAKLASREEFEESHNFFITHLIDSITEDKDGIMNSQD